MSGSLERPLLFQLYWHLLHRMRMIVRAFKTSDRIAQPPCCWRLNEVQILSIKILGSRCRIIHSIAASGDTVLCCVTLRGYSTLCVTVQTKMRRCGFACDYRNCSQPFLPRRSQGRLKGIELESGCLALLSCHQPTLNQIESVHGSLRSLGL